MQELLSFNTDFDFSLSAAPDLVTRIREVSQRKELLFWSLGTPERRYICHGQPPPPAFAQQMARYGLEALQPAQHGNDYSSYSANPWGWNNQVIQEFTTYGCRVSAPPQKAVRQANSRLFAFQLAQKLGLDLPGSATAFSSAEVLARLKDLHGPAVVKPIFGNAGIGLTFVENWPLTAQQEATISESLAQGGGAAIIEPWVQRTDDFSTYFQLEQDGTIRDFTIQRCLVGRSGSFYGMIIEPGQKLSAAPLLQQVAQEVASSLQDIGYFGPVVIDGYSYRMPDGTLAINPLVEINARQTMGMIARHLYQKLSPTGAILFRLARRKRCQLPENLQGVDDLLGKSHYQAGAEQGIAVLTPLASALPRAQVLQHLFAVVGRNSLDCLNQLALLESQVLKTKEPVEIIQQFSLL